MKRKPIPTSEKKFYDWGKKDLFLSQAVNKLGINPKTVTEIAPGQSPHFFAEIARSFPGFKKYRLVDQKQTHFRQYAVHQGVKEVEKHKQKIAEITEHYFATKKLPSDLIISHHGFGPWMFNPRTNLLKVAGDLRVGGGLVLRQDKKDLFAYVKPDALKLLQKAGFQISLYANTFNGLKKVSFTGLKKIKDSELVKGQVTLIAKTQKQATGLERARLLLQAMKADMKDKRWKDPTAEKEKTKLLEEKTRLEKALSRMKTTK